MLFSPWPWRNRKEGETTPLDRQNLNSAEVAQAQYAEGLAAAEKERAEAAEALKAPLASPALTGVPTAPSQAAKDSTTKIATDAFVQTAKAEAEAASDPAGTSAAGVKVEKERAEAAEALKAPLASPALTGVPTTTEPFFGSNSSRIASTHFVAEMGSAAVGSAAALPLSPSVVSSSAAPAEEGMIPVSEGAGSKIKEWLKQSLFARLVSPAFTGAPTAPTPAVGDNGTHLVTTAFVNARPTLYGKYGLRRFRAAAGDAIYKPVPIVCVGDSITAGQGGDNSTGVFNNVPDNTQGWVGQLRQMLAASPQTGALNPGEGFWFSNDSRLTVEGGPAANNYACVPLRNGYRLIKNTQNIKLAAIPPGVTKIGIIQANMDKAFNEAGSKLADVTGSYKLGAGAETALTALTNTRLPVEQQIAVTAGEALTVYGPPTAQTYIVGLTMYTGNNGIVTHRIGQPGYVIGDTLGGQKVGTLLQSASAENQVAAARSTYSWAGATGLVILSYLTNDQFFQATGGTENERGVTLTKFTEWMKQYANQAIADGWCVLLLGEPRNPNAAIGEGIATLDQYCAAMENYALETEHASFIDVGELWGTNAASTSLGLTQNTSVHPLRNGHGDIARMVYRAILGNAPAGISSVEAA